MNAGVEVSLTQWAALVGTCLPLVISFVKQDFLSERANAVIVMLVSGLAGFATAEARGLLTTQSWAVATITIIVTAAVTYRAWWKPIGLSPAIQSKTSFKRGRHEAKPEPLDVT